MALNTELLDEIPPGEVLLEDFIKPFGLTATRLAGDIDVAPSRITNIIKHGQEITVDTACRLALYFGTTPEFWINLQTAYNLRMARRELMPRLAGRVRVLERVLSEGRAA